MAQLANYAWIARWGSRGPLLAVLSGLHGDEIGGPLGLLDWVNRDKDRHLPSNQQLWMLPLANDLGWNARTREWESLDLNRAFLPGRKTPEFIRQVMRSWKRRVPDLFLDFHEDDEFQGSAYLFRYTLEAHNLAERMADSLGMGLLDWEEWTEWEGCSEIFLRRLGLYRCVTIETSGKLPLEERSSWVGRVLDWTIAHLPELCR